MRLVLVAEEAAGRQALQVLAGMDRPPCAVLTSSAETPPGRLAARLGLPVLPAGLVREESFADWLRAEQADILLNVHSLHVIRPDVAAAPRIGSFNLHPGPLPDYAGLNTVGWALVNGEAAYGVTLHWIGPAIDGGPVAYRADFPLEAADTALLVAMRCVQHGLPLIRRLVADAAATPHRIPAIPQDASRRRYYGRGIPFGGHLDWRLPARTIERLVRAFDYTPMVSPWGRLTARLGEAAVEIRKVRLTGDACSAAPGTIRSDGAGGVLVAAADEWVRLPGIAAAAAGSVPLPEGARFEVPHA